MKDHKKYILALGAGAMLMLGANYSEAAQWDMPTAQAATSLTGIADGRFAEILEKKTNGKIKVTVHYGGSLGYKGKDHYDAVSTGAVILADSYTGPFVGFDPVWQVSAVPFLTGSIDDAWTLFQVTKPYYEKALAKDNQILLYSIPWTASGIWAKKPVKSKEDLAGLKIRTFDPLGLMTFKAAGASPVTLGFSDVIPQLATSGIDAVLTSEEGGYKNKLQDLVNHFNEINYASPLSVVHMNKDAWDALSAEEKAAVKEASAEAEKEVWKMAKDRVQENYALMKKDGMTIVTDLPSGFIQYLKDSSKAAIEEWKGKAGERGAQILSKYESMRAK